MITSALPTTRPSQPLHTDGKVCYGGFSCSCTWSSEELTYVNVGHNESIIFAYGAPKLLEPTGMPLGLFSGEKV